MENLTEKLDAIAENYDPKKGVIFSIYKDSVTHNGGDTTLVMDGGAITAQSPDGWWRSNSVYFFPFSGIYEIQTIFVKNPYGGETQDDVDVFFNHQKFGDDDGQVLAGRAWAPQNTAGRVTGVYSLAHSFGRGDSIRLSTRSDGNVARNLQNIQLTIRLASIN